MYKFYQIKYLEQNIKIFKHASTHKQNNYLKQNRFMEKLTEAYLKTTSTRTQIT